MAIEHSGSVSVRRSPTPSRAIGAVAPALKAIATFTSRQDAQTALTKLKEANFKMEQVSVIAQEASSYDYLSGANVSNELEPQAETTPKEAIATDGTGDKIGLSNLTNPVIDSVAEVGTLLANTLLGAGIDAGGSALVDVLVAWGIAEKKAQYYGDRFSQGDYLIIIEGTEAEITTTQTILNNQGIGDWER